VGALLYLESFFHRACVYIDGFQVKIVEEISCPLQPNHLHLHIIPGQSAGKSTIYLYISLNFHLKGCFGVF
jgi:diadenosine tetraphosphate (Ap4A) HIT family hydrolase